VSEAIELKFVSGTLVLAISTFKHMLRRSSAQVLFTGLG
jgi:hypothetical protein